MSKKIDLKMQLQRLNLVSAVSYVILAVLSGVLISNKTYPITLPHLTEDSLLTQHGAVIVPASKLLFDFAIKWLLLGTMVVAAILPLLQATRWQTSYQKALKAKVSLWRWVDAALINSLLLGVVAMLFGVTDLLALKFGGIIVVLAFVFIWLAERQPLANKKPSRLMLVLGALTLALPVLFLILSGLGTITYGSIRASWYVYAAFGIAVVGLKATVWNLRNQLVGYKAWKDYLVAERNYLVINLVTRIALVAVLLIGLH